MKHTLYKGKKVIKISREDTIRLTTEDRFQVRKDVPITAKINVSNVDGKLVKVVDIPEIDIKLCELDKKYTIEFAYEDTIYRTPNSENICVIDGTTHGEFIDEEDCLAKYTQMLKQNEENILNGIQNTYKYLVAKEHYHGKNTTIAKRYWDKEVSL